MKKVERAKLKALEKGRKEYQRKVKAGMIERLNPHQKAIAKPGSLRLAINGACFECVGGENWHNRVRYCNMFSCSLWAVRKNAKTVTRKQCDEWVEVG